MTVTEIQKTAEVSDGNGGKIKLRRLSEGLLRGVCPQCGQTVYAGSNLGMMICPHCSRHVDEWRWGKLETVFFPEEGE